jgi:hypothetical protein
MMSPHRRWVCVPSTYLHALSTALLYPPFFFRFFGAECHWLRVRLRDGEGVSFNFLAGRVRDAVGGCERDGMQASLPRGKERHAWDWLSLIQVDTRVVTTRRVIKVQRHSIFRHCIGMCIVRTPKTSLSVNLIETHPISRGFRLER